MRSFSILGTAGYVMQKARELFHETNFFSRERPQKTAKPPEREAESALDWPEMHRRALELKAKEEDLKAETARLKVLAAELKAKLHAKEAEIEALVLEASRTPAGQLLAETAELNAKCAKARDNERLLLRLAVARGLLPAPPQMPERGSHFGHFLTTYLDKHRIP